MAEPRRDGRERRGERQRERNLAPGRRPKPAATLKPGTITKVEPTLRDPERLSIFVDGRFALALPDIVVHQRGLRAGVVLDEAAVEELTAVAEVDRATNAALHFVGYRPRSEREVRDRLRQRQFAPEAIDAAIEQLRRWNYLDDRSFAEYWVENRVEHSPRGRRRIAAELRAKGVDREVVSTALDNAELDELPAALELARKRLPSLKALDEHTQKRRLTGYLGRRGYGWDVIGPVMRQLFDDVDELA